MRLWTNFNIFILVFAWRACAGGNDFGHAIIQSQIGNGLHAYFELNLSDSLKLVDCPMSRKYTNRGTRNCVNMIKE